MSNVSLSKNSLESIQDSTNIFGDTIVINDTDGTNWIIPCIDCFIRIEAVRKDKEQCEYDNAQKNIAIQKLVADNREWRTKTKLGIISGFISGVLGTYLIMK